MFRGVGRNALDLPVAGLAGAGGRLRRLRHAAGFASPTRSAPPACRRSSPPPQPPLGLTARVAIALGGALVTFGLVFLLLRLLDRSGLDAPRGKAAAGPRPARRPRAPPRLPSRRAGPPADLGRAATSASRRRRRRPKPIGCRPGWTRPSPSPDRVTEPAPSPSLNRFRSPSSPSPSAEMPIEHRRLMERLEQGLARRQPRRGAHRRRSPPPPQVFPEAPDDRLQSAIDSLQRLAARQPPSSPPRSAPRG